MEETVFDYNLDEIEIKCLNVMNLNKETYLSNTKPFKRLADLYALFSMRRDWINCERIGAKIQSLTKNQ
jgi:hypothetical protein